MEKDPRALESESHTASQLNDSNIETMTPFTENRCISHYSDIIAPPAAHIENSVVSPNTSALPDNDESCSAHATEKSLPDSVPSTEDIMLRSLLRGVKGSPSPSRHSHPVTSFSPRRLTEEELYGEPVTNSPIEDVATLKDIDPLTHMPDDDDDDDDDYDFNTGSGARLASSIVAHRSTERDRHRSTTSNNKKDDIGDNKDDSAPRDSASQRNDVNEARVFPNVDTSSTLNASTSINTPTISDDSKEKRRQNYLDSLVASLTEPTSPFSPPSRAPKRVRFDEPEDPFENFNSGSEPEDEADVDFKTASRSPSLHGNREAPNEQAKRKSAPGDC
ncbi:MAG: hypothetical protein L6R40_004062 [Gallowayella cf. fulva]|nr:MAG: hypothetical protein L6R40_004062 [Xanthomendoza cf. fulva]